MGALVWVLVGGALLHALLGPRSDEAPVAGLRRVAAGWVWLEVNRAWEQGDAPLMRRWLAVVVRVSPETLAFRLNGARMLAYDVPAWRAGLEPDAPAAVKAKWRREAAMEALRWLEAVPSEVEGLALDLERGALCWRGLDDPAAAAVHYQLAAGRVGAPGYAARIAARLRGEAR